jgi:hypothetical protein
VGVVVVVVEHIVAVVEAVTAPPEPSEKVSSAQPPTPIHPDTHPQPAYTQAKPPRSGPPLPTTLPGHGEVDEWKQEAGRVEAGIAVGGWTEDLVLGREARAGMRRFGCGVLVLLSLEIGMEMLDLWAIDWLTVDSGMGFWLTFWRYVESTFESMTMLVDGYDGI